jgi:protein-S-isoprenylcysteine O-methyltransferase Ste14
MDAKQANAMITPILAVFVMLLSFGLFGVLSFVEVQEASKDILIYILGVLSASVTQVLSFYFGSSAGSKRKDEINETRNHSD